MFYNHVSAFNVVMQSVFLFCKMNRDKGKGKGNLIGIALFT